MICFQQTHYKQLNIKAKKLMGDFLSKPNTEKNATDGKSDKYAYGACSMQGWRKTNEDAHIHHLDLGDGNSLFGVFDGHGGE
jgi:protein phosphatase 1G